MSSSFDFITTSFEGENLIALSMIFFTAVENKVHKDEEWGLAISLLISIILIYESFLRLFGINLNID